MKRATDLIDSLVVPAAISGGVLLVVMILVSCFRDSQVRTGVIVAREHHPGYFYCSGDSKSQTMVWQPETFELRIRGEREDTHEVRVATVSVDEREYDQARIGDTYSR